MKAYIMQGIPGSGKTWYLNRVLMVDGGNIASADDFRIVDGKYIYKPEDDFIIHNKCLKHFIMLCQEQRDVVACDNTNIGIWHFATYYRVAEAFGYDARMIRMVAEFNKCLARQTHSVPSDVMQRMMQTMQGPPSHFSFEQVIDESPSPLVRT